MKSRRDKSHGRHGAILLLVFGVTALSLVGCGRTGDSSGAALPEGLRGEPINPAPVAAVASPSNPPSAGRKRYPKPASFQKRMVEYYAGRTNGAEPEPFAPLVPNPGKVRYTREQLDSIDDPSVPASYEKTGFHRLSAFPFEVTPEMADGSTHLEAASQSTRSKIPDSVRALDGRLVAIRGFLIPLRMDEGLTVEFLLMRDQNLCCFGSVPKVNEWILVRTEGRGVKPVMDRPITVMGRLQVGELRENGYLTGIYRLDADRIIGPD